MTLNIFKQIRSYFTGDAKKKKTVDQVHASFNVTKKDVQKVHKTRKITGTRSAYRNFKKS